jgi:hypothetical protein
VIRLTRQLTQRGSLLGVAREIELAVMSCPGADSYSACTSPAPMWCTQSGAASHPKGRLKRAETMSGLSAAPPPPSIETYVFRPLDGQARLLPSASETGDEKPEEESC